LKAEYPLSYGKIRVIFVFLLRETALCGTVFFGKGARARVGQRPEKLELNPADRIISQKVSCHGYYSDEAEEEEEDDEDVVTRADLVSRSWRYRL